MLHNKKAKLSEHNKSCLNSSTLHQPPSIYFMKRQQLASLFYPIIFNFQLQSRLDDEVKKLKNRRSQNRFCKEKNGPYRYCRLQ
jgi:hypothetical protein